ncbi:MAG: hypothetical protein V3W41_18180 [Planctomycetota bacterium]
MILFALIEEAAPFRKLLASRGYELKGSASSYRAQKGDAVHDVRVIGPGAANMNEWLATLEESPPARLIHAGFAGALHPELPRSQLCFIEAIADEDAFHELPPTPEQASFRRLGYQPTVLRSVAAPADAAAKAKLALRTSADLVDMESATAFAWARQHDVPYTGLRIVSDIISDDLPNAVVMSYDGRQFRRSYIFGQVLRHPSLVPELLELRDRSQVLALKLAEALLALDLPPA